MLETDLQEPVRPRPVAVIDIGTTSIRMAVAEIHSPGVVRQLDAFSRAVSLGRDTFHRRKIRRSTIEECVRVLRSYRRVLDEYGIQPAAVRVVATSAVREATNRLAFMDRIYIATGLEVEALEEAEVNRVTYMSIYPHLESRPELSQSRSVVIEVGGGSTELLLVRGPNVVYSHTYRLGSLRMRRSIEALRAPLARQRELMETQIARMIEQLQSHMAGEERVQLIALGGDLRFAARQLLPDWTPAQLASLPTERLAKFVNQLLPASDEELVQRFHISFPDASTLGPALLANLRVAQALGAESLLVSSANLRDGLLQEMAARDEWSANFAKQITRSAIDLAGKYDSDLKHVRHVASLAVKLFREIRQEHQLPSSYEVLLNVAALLHDVGRYVNVRSHHKHSMYLIRNSELFGLGNRDMLITSLVARYHRRATPQPNHEGYAMLPRVQRVAVAKMAAMLRVAIALDESRSQRITDFHCVVKENQLVITIRHAKDLSLEQMAIRQDNGMFEEVFGLRVLLRPQG
ncbi:MAG: HD domain-containing protein [Planctomycetales bacterium]|nr:HD domain-containing protein [Planctomycetales bacterium]